MGNADGVEITLPMVHYLERATTKPLFENGQQLQIMKLSLLILITYMQWRHWTGRRDV
jgi:hypothetical protein